MDRRPISDQYDYDRAERELAMAQKAQTPEAVRAHTALASLYLDRFFNPAAPRPAPFEAPEIS
jgi:hypothetical protein